MLARLRCAAVLAVFIGGAGLTSTLLYAQESDPLHVLPEGAAPAARVVKPDRIGYAFSDPPILLRQRLIGLAHGLRLLGRTCLLDPEFSLSAEQAYAAWFARQGPTIDAMSLDLERWYFGTAVPGADPAARLREVIRLLGLRTQLRTMDADEQRAACASYPQAIAGPRYDFVTLLEETARELAEKAKPAPAEIVEATAALPEAPAVKSDLVAPDAVDAGVVEAGSVKADPAPQSVAPPEEQREASVTAQEPMIEPLGDPAIANPSMTVEATHE